MILNYIHVQICCLLLFYSPIVIPLFLIHRSSKETAEIFNPVPDDVPMPEVQACFEMVKQHTPDECILNVLEVHQEETFAIPEMPTLTPSVTSPF